MTKNYLINCEDWSFSVYAENFKIEKNKTSLSEYFVFISKERSIARVKKNYVKEIREFHFLSEDTIVYKKEN